MADESSQKNIASIILVVIIIAAFVLYMIAFSVPFTHTAVVTTFGKVTRTISGLESPGLHWKWPWPIEKVSFFDNRLRVHESKLEQLFTADEQSITVMVYTAWRISPEKEDVIKYLKEISTEDKAQLVLTGLAHDAMGKVIGEHNFEDFVSTDPNKMKFTQIEEELKTLIARQALESYGIEVKKVGIKRLELPEDATKKVFERMKAEREQLAKKYRAEGESKAREIRAEANKIAGNIENRARAEAIAIRGQGDVEAAKYYSVFAENPQLHNFIKRLEALKEILPKRSTLIMEAGKVPPFDLLSSKIIDWLSRGYHLKDKGKLKDKDAESKNIKDSNNHNSKTK